MRTDARSTTSGTLQVSWKQELARAVRDPDELVDLLRLPDRFRECARRAAELFPLVVPRDFVRRMEPGNPDDPLLRQVLPLDVETESVEGFSDDPLAERDYQNAPGLLHKYGGRVLLVAVGSCAVNCRYCFRRHFPYEDVPKGLTAWQPALDAIESDDSVREVILSGGDPLLLTDDLLARLLERLEANPHLTRVRIHSRLPVVLPARMTQTLVHRLRASRLTPFRVIHANHASELVGRCAGALGELVDNGIPVLNQAVLLRGVNDDLEALQALCERLIDLRGIPYYLRQLDSVAGAAHFFVVPHRGVELVEELRRRLPGYEVPTYVRGVCGAASMGHVRT